MYVQGFLDCLAFCYTSRVLTLWSLRIFGGAGNTTPSSKMFPFATDGENSDHFNSSDQESSENLLQPLNGSEGFYMDRGGLFSSIDEQLSDTRSSSKIFASESSSVFLGSQSSVQVGDLVSVYFEDSI